MVNGEWSDAPASRRFMPSRHVFMAALAVQLIMVAGPARGAEDPGARALQQDRMTRQQSQDALQLRLQQQQRAVQSPPPGARRRDTLEALDAEQRQRREIERVEAGQRPRQQELQYRQQVEPRLEMPSEGEGAWRAREALERQRAQSESREELRRFDDELRKAREQGAAGGER